LQHLQFLVLDEVDRLFKDGLWPDIDGIISHLPAARPTLLFSATLDDAIPYAPLLGSPPVSAADFGYCSPDGYTFFWRPSAGDPPPITHLIWAVPAHVRELFLTALLDAFTKRAKFRRRSFAQFTAKPRRQLR
jgi:hypothetical protein